MQTKNILVTSTTSNYREFLYVFLGSIKVHLRGNYEVIILHTELEEEIKSRAKKIANDSYDLHFCDISSYLCSTEFWSNFENPIYWRLIAPHISETSEKILYLDTDIMVRQDFSELFSYDLEGNTIGACVDYLSEIQLGINNWIELQLNPKKAYFNAGVMLIDAKKFKMKSVARKVEEVLRHNRDYLIAFNKWPQYDQYGLNVVMYDDWSILPQCYNYGSELAFSHAKIIHFIGNGKPSSPTCTCEYTREFNFYLKKFSS